MTDPQATGRSKPSSFEFAIESATVTNENDPLLTEDDPQATGTCPTCGKQLSELQVTATGVCPQHGIQPFESPCWQPSPDGTHRCGKFAGHTDEHADAYGGEWRNDG